MRWLLTGATLLALAGAGGWFGGKVMIERTITDLVSDQRAQGNILETGEVAISGFPYRFEITAPKPLFSAPSDGITWSGSPLQLYAMSWKPWHIIASLPKEQSLTLPNLKAELSAQSLEASLRAKPTLDLPLAEARLESRALTLSAPVAATIGHVLLALRESTETSRLSEAPASYDLSVAAQDLSLPELTARLRGSTSTLPEVISELQLDASLGLNATLDRHLGQAKPHLEAIDIRAFKVTWGEINLTATGKILPDSKGFAEGKITLTLEGAEQVAPLLLALGVIQPNAAGMVDKLLQSMAGESGVAALSLVLKDGWMSFGPLPLGPAPKLR